MALVQPFGLVVRYCCHLLFRRMLCGIWSNWEMSPSKVFENRRLWFSLGIPPGFTFCAHKKASKCLITSFWYGTWAGRPKDQHFVYFWRKFWTNPRLRWAGMALAWYLGCALSTNRFGESVRFFSQGIIMCHPNWIVGDCHRRLCFGTGTGVSSPVVNWNDSIIQPTEYSEKDLVDQLVSTLGLEEGIEILAIGGTPRRSS